MIPIFLHLYEQQQEAGMYAVPVKLQDFLVDLCSSYCDSTTYRSLQMQHLITGSAGLTYIRQFSTTAIYPSITSNTSSSASDGKAHYHGDAPNTEKNTDLFEYVAVESNACIPLARLFSLLGMSCLRFAPMQKEFCTATPIWDTAAAQRAVYKTTQTILANASTQIIKHKQYTKSREIVAGSTGGGIRKKDSSLVSSSDTVTSNILNPVSASLLQFICALPDKVFRDKR